jgi:hypothetical protein
VYRILKNRLVGLGRLIEAADLAHELRCRSLSLLCGYGRIEIKKRLDIPAHWLTLSGWLLPEL